MFQRTADEKLSTVLSKNTYFYFDRAFEERYDNETITVMTTLLYNVQEKVKQNGVRKEIFDELLLRPRGLMALLALNGLSFERLQRIITAARIFKDEGLDNLILRKEWSIPQDLDKVEELTKDKFERLVRSDDKFRLGLLNLFFEGASDPLLAQLLPPFDLKKLSVRKLSFEVDDMIDTLVRYKEYGSYKGRKDNNAEETIKLLLNQHNLTFQKGDLSDLVKEAANQKRTMDFIIPSKLNPKLIIECSYLTTTASSQGDKAKTEIGVGGLLKSHYPQARFIGFVDGIGWYVRKGDLKRMIVAYDDVFTFHQDELLRFGKLLKETFDGV